ncbi:unnamed protein product, partial [Prorocentrum cordatum]
GLLGVLDRWGVPALQAWVARCPAIDIPPCPARPACPPCPGATVGATASSVAFACLAGGLAGAAFGALGAIAALRLWGPLRFTAESEGKVAARAAWAWVLHNVAGAPLFHQKRVAWQLAFTDDVVIVTPDDMVYAERLLAAGPDIAAVRFSAARWPPPPGIAPESTYRFGGAPSAAREAAWLAAALAEADAEFARRHPGALLPAGGALLPMSGGLLPGAAAPAAAVPAAVPAPAGWAWVVAEDVESFCFGAAVQVGPISGIVLAARAGRPGTLTLGAGASAVAFILEDWRTDPRTTACLPGSVGPRSWLSATESAREVVDPLFVLQPRSAAWRVSWLLRDGGAHPVSRELEGAEAALYGVAEHHALSTVLGDLATVDEVNAANLVGVERPLRRMQLIEHFWGGKQREQDASLQKLPQEEVSAFMGGTGPSSRSSSMVCPALLDAVGKELERASQLKKNVRKLREEAKAAPGAKAGAVESLSDLSGAGGAGAGCSLPLGDATLAQQRCLARIAGAVSQLGPLPGDLQPLAALQELRAAASYDGMLSTRAEAMDVSRLSLPLPGNCPVSLERLLESEVSDTVYRDISDKVLPKTETSQLKWGVGSRKPYMDPIVRGRRQCATPVLRLLEAGVIDLVGDPGEVVDEAGLFSAPRKSGRQRLVVDARPANFWFSDPADVRLATGSAQAAIELPDGASPWAASADIADASYNIELPHVWRPYFAPPPIDARWLGREADHGQEQPRLLRPRLAVLPMGWARALAVCQRVSESAADRAGLAAATRVVGRQVCPGMAGGAHLEYVDNFASLSLDRDTTEQMKNDMVATPRESGPPVHEEESAALHAQLLGWVIDGERGSASPTPRRARRLILATRALLDMPKVSAQQVRQVVGHYAFVLMVMGPLLSIFSGRGESRARTPAPREQLAMPPGPNESLIGTESPSRPNDLGSSQAPAKPLDIAKSDSSIDANRKPRRPDVFKIPATDHLQTTGFEPLEGSSSLPRMARICRQWPALAVAGGISAALRWTPSEANPADLPSRWPLRTGARLQWGAVASLAAAQEPCPPGGEGAGRHPAASAAGGGPHLGEADAELPRAPAAASLRASAGHVLRALSGKVATRTKNMHLWEEFTSWLATASFAPSTETADDLLAQRRDQQHAQGWHPERGAHMLAALKPMMPQFVRGGLGLPKALQVVALVAARLIDVGQALAAIHARVVFAGYQVARE